MAFTGYPATDIDSSPDTYGSSRGPTLPAEWFGGAFKPGGMGRDPGVWLGTAGTLGSGIGSMMDYFQRRGDQRKLQRLARSPIDPSAYYGPMSDAAQAAHTRAIQAQQASQGIPFDSSYAKDMAAEALARTETERWLASMGLAGDQRKMQMESLMRGRGPSLMSSLFGGGAGAMGSAMQAFQMRQERERAEAARQSRVAAERKQMMDMIQSMMQVGRTPVSTPPLYPELEPEYR
jgi:hypothetical protein